MNINGIDSVNFMSTRPTIRYMSTIDGRRLSDAVREYGRTFSEEARLRAFEIYDPYMVQEAKRRSKEGVIYEDYLQNLRLNFFLQLEEHKGDKKISAGICRAMSYVMPSDDDKILSNINGGFITLAEDFTEHETNYCQNKRNNIEEAESNNRFQELINDETLFTPIQRDILKLHYEGYSFNEIASKIHCSKETVRTSLRDARLKLAIEYDNKTQDDLRKEIVRVFKSFGCVQDENGKFIKPHRINRFLEKAHVPLSYYYIAKDFGEGKSFRTISTDSDKKYKTILHAVNTVTESLDKYFDRS